MPQCEYRKKADFPLDITFECKEPSIANSKFCIFHDKDRYAEHEQEAAKRFEEKVRESISQNKPLECIGYYLPSIDFEKLLQEKRFAFAIYFNRATFYEEADFSEATFSKEADFSEATFSKEAQFGKCTFSERAKFWHATFSEMAVFAGATFSMGAEFSWATFSETAYFGNAKFSERTDYSGPTDFSQTTFSKVAAFTGANFSKRAGFIRTTFAKEARFQDVTFSEGAFFYRTTFLGEAYFLNNTFTDTTIIFRYTTFEQPTRVTFEDCDLSNVSFANNDVTRLVFGDKITWRGGEDGFTIIEEEWLKRKAQAKKYVKKEVESPAEKDRLIIKIMSNSTAGTAPAKFKFEANISGGTEPYRINWNFGDEGGISDEQSVEHTFILSGIHTVTLNVTDSEGQTARNSVEITVEDPEQDVNLELVLSVYRNLRENYEFRLRYDDAGKFFIKEMELKRKYRESKSENGRKIEENDWFRKHFSLTGLYYHLSRYGESIARPALVGAITVLLSTLFWVTQSNPTLEPHFSPSLEAAGNSTFVGFREIGNATQWLKGFERSLAGFIPILSLGGETKVGIIDYIIKIFGGGLTFVLLAIALRRKFERKYTR